MNPFCLHSSTDRRSPRCRFPTSESWPTRSDPRRTPSLCWVCAARRCGGRARLGRVGEPLAQFAFGERGRRGCAPPDLSTLGRGGALGLSGVIAYARVENVPSRRVMEKLGLTYEREFEHLGRPHVSYRKHLAA
jgi:hypothetical protein